MNALPTPTHAFRPSARNGPLSYNQGVGHHREMERRVIWGAVERSQIGHHSGSSSRSDRVLLKLEVSIAERNIYFRSTRRECMFDGHMLALL